MNIRHLILAVIGIVLLSACDIARGPAFFNATDHVVVVTPRFTEGDPGSATLQPGQLFGQLARGIVLESFDVSENGRRREFGKESVEQMLRSVHSAEDALVILRTNTVEIRSLKEASRQRFFDAH